MHLSNHLETRAQSTLLLGRIEKTCEKMLELTRRSKSLLKLFFPATAGTLRITWGFLMIPEIPKKSGSPRNRVQELLCETVFCWLPLLPVLLQFGGTWDKKGCDYTRSSKNIKAEVQKKQEDFLQPGTLDVHVYHGLTKQHKPTSWIASSMYKSSQICTRFFNFPFYNSSWL